MKMCHALSKIIIFLFLRFWKCHFVSKLILHSLQPFLSRSREKINLRLCFLTSFWRHKEVWKQRFKLVLILIHFFEMHTARKVKVLPNLSTENCSIVYVWQCPMAIHWTKNTHLNQFQINVPLHFPWKQLEARDLLMFSEGTEREH